MPSRHSPIQHTSRGSLRWPGPVLGPGDKGIHTADSTLNCMELGIGEAGVTDKRQRDKFMSYKKMRQSKSNGE